MLKDSITSRLGQPRLQLSAAVILQDPGCNNSIHSLRQEKTQRKKFTILKNFLPINTIGYIRHNAISYSRTALHISNFHTATVRNSTAPN